MDATEEMAQEAQQETTQQQETASDFFESIKTSLPRLDIFDPSVFNMPMLIGAVVVCGMTAFLLYRMFVKNVVGEDNFLRSLGVSYCDFDMPDEIDEYYDLLDSGEEDPVAIRKALLKRAIADIPLIMRMENEGPGMNNMYQQAMIGDKEWHAFQAAEQAIMAEIESVQEEADELQPGLSHEIWSQAMRLRQALKERQLREEQAKELLAQAQAGKAQGGAQSQAAGQKQAPAPQQDKKNGDASTNGNGAVAAAVAVAKKEKETSGNAAVEMEPID